MIKASWRALSALALLAAIGCGEDSGSDPEGSISVTVSPTLLSVPQGGTGTVTVTLTRGGGFEEVVNVSVEGRPAGVTATVNPESLTGGTTQAIVTVNVAGTVAIGSYPITIRASAGGIGAATTQYTLDVTAPPTPGFTLTATAASVAAGGSGTSTIGIQRINFTGNVALTLDNPPAGITGTFNPASTTGGTSSLTINVAGTVTPNTYNLTVKGTSAGQADRTATLPLTVTAAANYALSALPATLTIAPGGNSNTAVSINRTSFAGNVTLSLDAPPTGITATFNPASTTGSTSTATINVAGTVAPASHTLTIKGTATGMADKTTTVALTVSAAGSFTIESSPATMTMAPAESRVATITIVRTNLTADIALSLANPPTGITGTFTPPTLSGSALTSSLQVSVAGTVAPGPYTLTVQGVGGSVTRTTPIALTVAGASSVTLSMQPTALSIQQGSSGNAQLNLTRTNFTGNVTPSVTSTLPAGMTVTFNPNPITTQNNAQVTVNVGAGTPVGTHNLTITGAAGAAGNPTTTLAVTVTAATGGSNFNWDFCTAFGVPVKFWRLSGTTWAEVSPTVVGNVTRFSFSIATTTGGIAYTTQTSAFSSQSRRAPSKIAAMTSTSKQLRANRRLTNETLPQTTTYFDTFVQLGLTTELGGYAEVCGTTTSLVSKTFNVSNMGGSEAGVLGYGPASTNLSSSTPSYNLSVPSGSYDWAAVFGPTPTFPDFSASWTAYRQARNVAAPGTGPVSIDRAGATAFTTVPFTFTNGPVDGFYGYSEFIDGSRGNIVGFSLGSVFTNTNTGNLLFFAPADRVATDLTSLEALVFSADGLDLQGSLTFYGTPPASATITLPGAIPAFTVSQVNGAPVTTWSATGSIPAEYQTAVSPVSVNFEGANGAIITIDATRGWLLANSMGSTYTLTQPTLPNFLSQWAASAPLASTIVIMLGYDELAVPTAGSVLKFSGRLQLP